MSNALIKSDGGIASAAARADVWLFLLVAAGLGWLMWPRSAPSSNSRPRHGKPDGADRSLSRSERNLRDGEPMAGYGA
ncbi:MAG: hypothetical protein ACREET_07810 [Stellaceae bacterium]